MSTKPDYLQQPDVITLPTEPTSQKIVVELLPIPTINLDEAAPIVHPPVERQNVRHFSLMEIRPFLKSIDARLTRRRYSETTMREYLAQIQPTGLAEQYLEFYDAFPFHKEVCAGAKHHHWWKGGLEDHLREMIGIGIDIMDLYPGDFTFSKSDLIIAVFLMEREGIVELEVLFCQSCGLNLCQVFSHSCFRITAAG